MVRTKFVVSAWLTVSCTRMDSGVVEAAAGVPEMTPLDAMLRPEGSVPEIILDE